MILREKNFPDFFPLPIFLAIIMFTCAASDLSVFTSAEVTLGNCIASSMESQQPSSSSASVFPSGQVIRTCMQAAGVSTECSQCWGNIFDGVKTCYIDTCGFDVTSDQPPSGITQPSQACIDCLTNWSNQFANSQSSVCGFDVTQMGGMGENIRNQMGDWMPRGDSNVTTTSAPTTTGKSTFTTVSLRSITTSIFIFTLLIVSM